jgi:hypothetical protein
MVSYASCRKYDFSATGNQVGKLSESGCPGLKDEQD